MILEKENLKKHKKQVRYDFDEEEFVPHKRKLYREATRRNGRHIPLDDDDKIMQFLKRTERVRDLLRVAD